MIDVKKEVSELFIPMPETNTQVKLIRFAAYKKHNVVYPFPRTKSSFLKEEPESGGGRAGAKEANRKSIKDPFKLLK